MSDHVAPQEDRPELPEAPLDGLPQVLVSPPWTRPRNTKAPKQLPGLEPPAPQLVGRPGEFEAALALEPRRTEWDDAEFDDPEFQGYRTGWDLADNCLSQLARLGPTVADAAVEYIEDYPWCGRALLPVRSTLAAKTAAHWFLRLKDGRGPGLDWFDRHGLHAAPLLVPEAFGPKAYQRTTARGALRLLAWRYGADAVQAAVRPCGPEAAAAVAAVTADSLHPLLNDPRPGWWADTYRFPPVLTADRAAVLPPTAVRHLIDVLAQWAPRVPYPGLDVAAAACDRDSLARFSLALAEHWIEAESPSGDDWAASQLAYFGLPEAATLLEGQIPRWGGRRAAIAAVAMEALAAFPARTAFPPLYRLSRGKMPDGPRRIAAERARAVAARVGTEPETLADRLAPTLGLDDPATLTIDFGPRAFHVKPDDRLNLAIVDDTGRTRARLPRPGVRDDAAVAAASIARHRQLTKDLAAALAFHSARLEDAMLDGRLWTVREFARLTAHPILSALARGLLWIGGTAEAAQCFRIAEDGSLADVDDKPFTLADDDRVRLAHPVLLGPDLQPWTQVFADYAILQPFDQLVRPAFRLLPEEIESGILHRFTGATASCAGLNAVMDLEHLTHIRARNLPIEHCAAFTKALPGGVHLMAEVSPDPSLRHPDNVHRIQVIWFATTKNRRSGVPTLHGDALLDALDPVLTAEILAGLGRATGLHH